MLRLLTLLPAALYCCNMAMDALRMLKERGLRVPEDISMTSFDDVPLFALYHSAFTAVPPPIVKISDTIASILASRLAERGKAQPPHSIVLNCDIKLRDSVKPPHDNAPGGDEANARFIARVQDRVRAS